MISRTKIAFSNSSCSQMFALRRGRGEGELTASIHPLIPRGGGGGGGEITQQQRYCPGYHAAERVIQKCLFSTRLNLSNLCLRHMVINPYVLYL